jgi:hypothetical protein
VDWVDAALADVQLKGNWGPWLELLSRAVIEACQDSIAIAVDLVAPPTVR